MRITAPIAALAACTVPTTPIDPPTADTAASTTAPTFTLSPDLAIDDDANYAFDQSWTMAATQVKANPATILVRWTDKATDAWGAPRDDDSYGALALWKLSIPRSEVLARLSTDTLDAAITDRWSAPVAGETEIALEDLGFDVTAELAVDPAVTWMIALTDDAGSRTDVRDGLFLVPDAAQGGISVTIPEGGAETTWSARFGADTLRTDSGRDRYSLDLSGLTTDAYGEPFAVDAVDRVFVGRFEHVDEADDLGGDVLALSTVAAGWWTVGTGGFAQVDLSLAQDDAGGRFPGFTSDAQWLVGAVCSSCLGPAPKAIAIVEVRDP